MQFTFNCPTKIIMGQDCIKNNSEELMSLGKRVLVVTGGNSSKKNGSLDDIITALNKEGITYQIFDEVEQNPSLATVFRAGQLAREMQADFVIGVGGGSPLDAGKAIAVLAMNDINEQELMAKNWVKDPLPIVAVPTTAGTGSEVTPYAVLTVDWAETKMSIAGEKLFPRLAFLDSKYMDQLPWNITINTAVDALSHSIEGYLNNRASLYSDLLALESIRMLGGLLKTISANNISLAQREQLLYASMLGGIVIAQTGTNVVHALGYPLTYFKGLPHGLANGVLLVSALKFMAADSPERVNEVIGAMGFNDLTELGDWLGTLLPVVKVKLNQEEKGKFINATLLVKNLANCPVRPVAEDLHKMLVESKLVDC